MESVDSTRYEIRRATVTDIPELIRMQMALQRDMDRIRDNLLRPNRTNIANLREYYCTRIRDEQTELLIALAAESSRAVGMGAGKIWLHADYLPPKSGELIDLWVDPEHRRQNVARRIIAQLLRFFRANGVDFLVVSYVEGNPLGENLWKRLRFEPVLVTAAADRKNVEGMLGVPGRQVAPLAYRSSLAGSNVEGMLGVPGRQVAPLAYRSSLAGSSRASMTSAPAV
jgi:ribosomal protein S18 acetylase RimI-like enzyme